jgi:hypothetical protein
MPDASSTRETQFVLLDLPFACGTAADRQRNEFAERYPTERRSELVDDYLGGAEQLAARTLDAVPRRARHRSHATIQLTHAKQRNETHPDRLQPLDLRAAAPHSEPRDDHGNPIDSPLWSGDVTATHDVLLRVRRSKRDRDAPPIVEVVGEITRSVTFHAPGDFCFLAHPGPMSVARREGMALAATHPARVAGGLYAQVAAGFVRSLIPSPATVFPELSVRQIPYCFRDTTIARATMVRSLDVTDETPIPTTMPPAAEKWLSTMGRSQQKVLAQLLAEEPVWTMPALLQALTEQGFTGADSNKNAIRAMTYRPVRGACDRLLFRIGFDYRDAANRELVAAHQRFAMRLPSAKRRTFVAAAAAPDLSPALERLLADSVHDTDDHSRVTLFAELLRQGGAFFHLAARDMDRALGASGSLKRSLLSQYDLKHGWISGEAQQHAMVLFHDAFSQFITERLIPRLATMAVGSVTAAPTVDLASVRLRAQGQVAARGLEHGTSHEFDSDDDLDAADAEREEEEDDEEEEFLHSVSGRGGSDERSVSGDWDDDTVGVMRSENRNRSTSVDQLLPDDWDLDDS